MIDEILADGNCILGAVLDILNDGSAVASLHDVALATRAMIAECVEKRNPSKGGLATKFGEILLVRFVCELGVNGSVGGDNKLEIFVSKSDLPSTDVHCYGSVGVRGFVNSCQSILDSMDTEWKDRVFGNQGDVGVEIILPYIWYSSEQSVVRQQRANI